MPEWLIHGAAIVTSIAGMGWLALAMDVHWKQVRGEVTRGWAAPAALRTLGAVALITSLILCFAADQPSMSALVWSLSLTLGALAVALALASRPHWLAVLAPGGARRQE